ncbi:MAG: UbiD family decarboxylase, partial [Armatimonadota bacterium]|nr:UbiD family decarboxylase [Armatimonadota bacterium]
MEGTAPQDLREWLDRVAEAGELAVVDAEVDWDQEMAAITYLWARRPGAPALLFRRVRGYRDRASCLWNLLGSSLRRMAITLGAPLDSTALDLVRHARQLFRRKIPPVWVDPQQAPVYENQRVGEEVDVLSLPVPKHWPRDGGRYGGTFDVVLTRDPEAGWVNVGTYRMMVHDRNHVGLYVSP